MIADAPPSAQQFRPRFGSAGRPAVPGLARRGEPAGVTGPGDGPPAAGRGRDDGTSGLRGRYVRSWRHWDKFGAGVYDRGVGEGVWRSNQHRLVLSLTPSAPLLLQVEGDAPTTVMPNLDRISFYPAGPEVRTVGTDSRYAHVCWDPDLVRSAAPGVPLPLQDRPELTFTDPLLAQLLTTLVEEIGHDHIDRLLADSLMTALVMRVAQRFGLPDAAARAPDLPQPRIRRVIEYIDAHLDRDLTLAELAGVACLSPAHFSRSFTHAVGTGPQRFTVQRRVERAKALLRDGRGSLAEIAAATGFADQSHFTKAFRQATGETPGRFRRITVQTANRQ